MTVSGDGNEYDDWCHGGSGENVLLDDNAYYEWLNYDKDDDDDDDNGDDDDEC